MKVYCTYHPAATLYPGGAVYWGYIVEDLRRLRLAPLTPPPAGTPAPRAVLGLDTEYLGKNLLTIGICDGQVAGAWERGADGQFLDRARQVLGKAAWLVVHSMPDDVYRLIAEGLVPPRREYLDGTGIIDSLLLAKLVDENRLSYELENLLAALAPGGVDGWKAPTKSKTPETWTAEERIARCRLDAWATLEAARRSAASVPEELYRFTARTAAVLFRLSLAGAVVDMSRYRTVAERVEAKTRQVEDQLHKMAIATGMTAFAASNDHHVRELVYERLRLPIIATTEKTDEPAVGRQVLSELLEQDVQAVTPQASAVLDLLIEHSAIDKFRGTYAEGLRKLIHPCGALADGTEIGWLPFNFNPLVRTGRRSSRNPNCFDGQTEILTEAGWTRFGALPRGVKVAQWDHGRVTFVEPTAYHEGVEELRLYENQHLSLAVTENHRCLLRHRKTGELRVFSGAEYPEDWQQIHGGFYGGDGGDGGEGLPLSDDELRLLVAIQADGAWTGSWTISGIEFRLARPRKIARLRQLLNVLGLKWTEREQWRKGFGKLRWSLRVYVRYAGAAKALLGPDKVFGPWLLQLSPAQREVVLKEIYYWDGCLSAQSMYSSSVKSNADWVQILHTLSGHRAKVRTYLGSKIGGPNYQVDVTRRDYSLTTNRRSRQLPAQKVYCVSVPSGYIVVRRDGKTAVTGQSQNWPKAARGIIRSRWVGGKIAAFDFSRLEPCIIAWLAEDEELLSLFLDGNGYLKIAEELWGRKIEEDTPMYQGTKSIVLGVHYDMGTDEMANQLWAPTKLGMEPIRFGSWREHWFETNRVRTKYLNRFPKLGEYMDRQRAERAETGQITIPSGRIRHLPGRGKHLDNQAINAPVQGTASDITASALLDTEAALLDEYGLSLGEWVGMLWEQRQKFLGLAGGSAGGVDPGFGTTWCEWQVPVFFNEVHDELTCDIPPDHEKRTEELVIETMQAASTFRKMVPSFDIPLKVGVKIRERWHGAK